MRAACYQQLGIPEEVIHVTDTSAPEITDPEEVKIRIKLSNITYSDIFIIKGQYGYFPPLPAIGGSEGVGVVTAIGSQVTRLQPGDRVLFFKRHAAWAEELVLRQEYTVKAPDNLKDEMAAQLITNASSAYGMLAVIDAAPGDPIIITAASTGVGKLLVQFAKHYGLKVIATIRNEIHREFLHQIGADEIINTSKENMINRVRSITGSKGAVAAVDSVAGVLSSQLLNCLRANGKILVYGSLSNERIPVNASQLIFKSISIQGFWTDTWADLLLQKDKTRYCIGKDAMIQLVADKNFVLPVQDIVPLDAIRSALSSFEQTGREGKLLIRCSD